MGWSQHLFGVLRRALSKEVKEQVGTDRFENKYYYIPEYKNWRGEMRARAAVGWSENDLRHSWLSAEWPAEFVHPAAPSALATGLQSGCH